QVSERFKKREFVLLKDENGYPQYIKFQLTQDRCSELDPFAEGDELKVQFDIKGNEYKKRDTNEIMYFTNLNAWRIEKGGAENVAPPAENNPTNSFPSANDEPPIEADDDLPF
ncbi:MAG: DUF3127 domain-containing protein, partial [Bacteroidota bacterium]